MPNYIFYQICTYKDKNNKYAIRKFVINEKSQILNIQNAKVSKESAEKLMTRLKLHEYKCFPAYDFDYIKYPNVNDVLQLRSPILGTNNDYSGYARF
jgi:hypothetical protein